MKRNYQIVLLVALACAAVVVIGHGIITSQKTQGREIPKEKLAYVSGLLKQRDYSKASVELTQIAEEYSNYTDVIEIHGWLHVCYDQQGLETEVLANARTGIARGRELLENHPDEYHLNSSIGIYYSILGEWENARKNFQKYIEAEALAERKDPSGRVQVHLKIADTYKNEQKWPEMVQEYQKVLDDPDNPYKVLKAEAQFSIAEAYRLHGREIFGTEEKAREEALRAYHKVVALYPEKECAKWRAKAGEQIRELSEKM